MKPVSEIRGYARTASKAEQVTGGVVFVDPAVEDYQSLVAGVVEDTEVVVLDAQHNGIEQISEVLARCQDLTSLHIVSHGESGSVQLGTGQLDLNTLGKYTSQLQGWAKALADEATILLYGCQVAAGELGTRFINQLSQLTGRAIAASTTNTGSAALKGDWELDFTTETIKTPLAFCSEVIVGYGFVLNTTRISVSSGGIQANDLSYKSAVSADGRYIVFISDATNLVPGDANGSSDVFVYDQQTGTTTRVSIASNGIQGNDLSDSPFISADGRYVVFYSAASNLVPGDTNDVLDVFVHDRQTGVTTRASTAYNSFEGNSSSYSSSISADGRYVAFESDATNLVPDDTNETSDIFVYDRLTGSDIQRIDPTVNFDWAGVPAPGIGADTFSVRWTGQVEAQYSELYTFYTQSDDGVRLWVNDQLLIDNWTDHGLTENNGTIALQAGQKYDIRMEFYENGGDAAARLLWSSASTAKAPIPQTQLFSNKSGDGLQAVYYDNLEFTGPAVTQINPTVNYNWGPGAPTAGIGAETFSVRWTGQVEAQYSELYTFYTQSDDGVRLWVNDQLLIDNWTDHGPLVEDAGTIALQAGQKYNIRLEYYENGGGAAIKLLWSSPSTPTSVIPQTQLYSNPVQNQAGDGLQATYYDNLEFISNTTRASTASDSVQGNSSSYSPSISADGRYVAFYSAASNLVPDDTNGISDIFVYDQQTGQTTRVSTASNGVEGNNFSDSPSISADGRYVAFYSAASNLVPDDTNETSDIFVYDRQTGQTTRVSTASNGTQGNGFSYSPSISGDGRYVAFESDATNLVPNDTNGTSDIFINDWQTADSNPGGDGLQAVYYDNLEFTGAAITQTNPTVNYDWALGVPTAGIGADTFSVRWTGQVEAQYSELYTFYTQSDDGVRLWVNDQLLIDNWTDHALTENNGTIALQAGQKYNVRMEFYENGGNATAKLLWSSALTAKAVIPQAQLFSNPVQSQAGDGLQAVYYDNLEFTGAAVTQTNPTVNYDWALGAPTAGIGADTFSVRWTGQVEAQYSELYTFYTQSDDGVRLWVNDQLLVDNWTDHALTENNGTIALQAGQKYNVRMEFYENGGNATAKLLWSSASTAKAVIPQAQLFSNPVQNSKPIESQPGDGLQAVYYNNLNFTGAAVTQTNPTVNFNWGQGVPTPGIGGNTFSVRWTGQVEAQYSELYTFYTQSNDGVRLWVNDQLLINNWTNHALTENNGTIALQAGQKYNIRMEFYENTGNATARLLWSSASTTKEVIPQSQLFSKAVQNQSANSLAAASSNTPQLTGNANPITTILSDAQGYDFSQSFSIPARNAASGNESQTDILWGSQATEGNDMELVDTANPNPIATDPVSNLNWSIGSTESFSSNALTNIPPGGETTGGNNLWSMNGITSNYGAAALPVLDPNWQIGV